MAVGLRSRPMQPEDVSECVRIIAEHPVIGPRYGRSIADLGSAWLRVLDCEAKAAMVIEQLNGSQATICFIGVAIFVGDDFVRELKRPPLRWFGPELARRVASGDLPMLSSRQLREANSRGGLTTITWEGCIRHGFEAHTELHRKIIGVFIEEHRGYLWKEAIASQLESTERLLWTIDSGGRLWDAAKARYAESLGKDPREILEKPHIVGVSREMEHHRPGTWVGALFEYRPPQLGFSKSQQQLLLSALLDRTDRELCTQLGKSPSTVKNTWQSIYNRVADHLPFMFSEDVDAGAHNSQRGPEKRRRLLAYLREHPEELRPVSRKLLQHRV